MLFSFFEKHQFYEDAPMLSENVIIFKKLLIFMKVNHEQSFYSFF